ncbi:hypothetical protein COS70_03180 [Candidatus Micrarchaeota archaeon CG06_land_8_20_14_3_00_50_6]|nr:MAG: hypothetical protein COS70_03180 [Candidatus Micrarchaeota archaeon CG06_land_8_20_14_3_00_50_6]
MYMNITLKLRGVPEEIVDRMIRAGIAESKTEAVRAALLFFEKEQLGDSFRQDFIESTLDRLKTEKPVRAKTTGELFQ